MRSGERFSIVSTKGEKPLTLGTSCEMFSFETLSYRAHFFFSQIYHPSHVTRSIGIVLSELFSIVESQKPSLKNFSHSVCTFRIYNSIIQAWSYWRIANPILGNTWDPWAQVSS